MQPPIKTQLVMLLLCAAAATGCGDDSQATGDNKEAGDSSAAGADTGAVSGDSSSTADAADAVAVTADSATAEADAATSSGTGDAGADKCGNGTCDAPQESILNCAQDCAGGANCGDGKCEGIQENGFTCPKDCKTDPGSIVGCVTKKCTSDLLQCMIDPDCVKTLGCVQACGSDIGCMAQCGANLKPETQQKLTGIVLCGGQKGCFGIGGSGGTCGDGKCEPPLENSFTCAKDCKAPVCGDGKCDPPLENALSCAKDCKLPVCGDGKCEPPLESTLTCAKDCKPKTCGNGTCDKPAETTLNCLEDCKPGSKQGACVATKCGKELAACGGDVKCGQAAFCTGQCGETGYKACFQNCGKGLPKGSQALFDQLETCADTNKCFN